MPGVSGVWGEGVVVIIPRKRRQPGPRTKWWWVVREYDHYGERQRMFVKKYRTRKGAEAAIARLNAGRDLLDVVANARYVMFYGMPEGLNK